MKNVFIILGLLSSQAFAESEVSKFAGKYKLEKSLGNSDCPTFVHAVEGTYRNLNLQEIYKSSERLSYQIALGKYITSRGKAISKVNKKGELDYILKKPFFKKQIGTKRVKAKYSKVGEKLVIDRISKGKEFNLSFPEISCEFKPYIVDTDDSGPSPDTPTIDETFNTHYNSFVFDIEDLDQLLDNPKRYDEIIKQSKELGSATFEYYQDLISLINQKQDQLTIDQVNFILELTYLKRYSLSNVAEQIDLIEGKLKTDINEDEKQLLNAELKVLKNDLKQINKVVLSHDQLMFTLIDGLKEKSFENIMIILSNTLKLVEDKYMYAQSSSSYIFAYDIFTELNLEIVDVVAYLKNVEQSVGNNLKNSYSVKKVIDFLFKQKDMSYEVNNILSEVEFFELPFMQNTFLSKTTALVSSVSLSEFNRFSDHTSLSKYNAEVFSHLIGKIEGLNFGRLEKIAKKLKSQDSGRFESDFVEKGIANTTDYTLPGIVRLIDLVVTSNYERKLVSLNLANYIDNYNINYVKSLAEIISDIDQDYRDDYIVEAQELIKSIYSIDDVTSLILLMSENYKKKVAADKYLRNFSIFDTSKFKKISDNIGNETYTSYKDDLIISQIFKIKGSSTDISILISTMGSDYNKKITLLKYIEDSKSLNVEDIINLASSIKGYSDYKDDFLVSSSFKAFPINGDTINSLASIADSDNDKKIILLNMIIRSNSFSVNDLITSSSSIKNGTYSDYKDSAINEAKNYVTEGFSGSSISTLIKSISSPNAQEKVGSYLTDKIKKLVISEYLEIIRSVRSGTDERDDFVVNTIKRLDSKNGENLNIVFEQMNSNYEKTIALKSALKEVKAYSVIDFEIAIRNISNDTYTDYKDDVATELVDKLTLDLSGANISKLISNISNGYIQKNLAIKLTGFLTSISSTNMSLIINAITRNNDNREDYVIGSYLKLESFNGVDINTILKNLSNDSMKKNIAVLALSKKANFSLEDLMTSVSSINNGTYNAFKDSAVKELASLIKKSDSSSAIRNTLSLISSNNTQKQVGVELVKKLDSLSLVDISEVATAIRSGDERDEFINNSLIHIDSYSVSGLNSALSVMNGDYLKKTVALQIFSKGGFTGSNAASVLGNVQNSTYTDYKDELISESIEYLLINLISDVTSLVSEVESAYSQYSVALKASQKLNGLDASGIIKISKQIKNLEYRQKYIDEMTK